MAISQIASYWHRLTGDRKGRLREQHEWAAVPLALRDPQYLVRLDTPDDYHEALAGLAPLSVERERYLRRQLWWLSNDHMRDVDAQSENQPVLPADQARANIERLLEIFPADGNAVEQIELLRQSARFDDALKRYAQMPATEQHRAAFHYRWCVLKDSTLKMMGGGHATDSPV